MFLAFEKPSKQALRFIGLNDKLLAHFLFVVQNRQYPRRKEKIIITNGIELICVGLLVQPYKKCPSIWSRNPMNDEWL